MTWTISVLPPSEQSLVIPILEYASQVWNPHTQKNIMRLENIQLRADRTALFFAAEEEQVNRFHWSKFNNLDAIIRTLVVPRKFSIRKYSEILYNRIPFQRTLTKLVDK